MENSVLWHYRSPQGDEYESAKKELQENLSNLEKNIMRDAFIEQLTVLAENDEKVMLLTGDLGYGVLTNFSEKFPDQFINVGVAEQNMSGLACGLALEGYKVFTYSIANFTTLKGV